MPTDIVTLAIECKTNNAVQNVRKFNKEMDSSSALASKLTKSVAGMFSVVAISRFAKENTKAYISLENSARMFDSVYSKNIHTARARMEQFRKELNLSEQSANAMIGATGNMLTSFGFSQEEALKLSLRVSKLGSDLASFRNYSGGAQGATEALTSAMLGETERAKTLGIVVRQDSKEFKDMTKNLIRMHGYTENMAKALVTLEIATKQSKNSLGAANADNLTNSLLKANNAIDDLRSSIGKNLAPSVKIGADTISSLVDVYKNAEEPTQRLIANTGMIVAGFAALRGTISIINIAQALNNKLTADGAATSAKAATERAKNIVAIKAESKASELNNKVKMQEIELRKKQQRFDALDQEAMEKAKQFNYYLEKRKEIGSDLRKARRQLDNISPSANPLEYATQAQKIRELKEQYSSLTTEVTKANNTSLKAVGRLNSAAAAVEKQKLALESARNAAKLNAVATDAVGSAAEATAVKMTLAQRGIQGFSRGLDKAKLAAKGLYNLLGPIGTVMIAYEAVSFLSNSFDFTGQGAVKQASKYLSGVQGQTENLKQKQIQIESIFASYQKNLEILRQLSKERELTSNGERSAISIIKQLEKANLDLGISYDKNTKSLTMAADAQDKLNASRKNIAERNIQDLLKANSAEIDALSAQREAIMKRPMFGVRGALIAFFEHDIKKSAIMKGLNWIYKDRIKNWIETSKFFEDEEQTAMFKQNDADVQKAHASRAKLMEQLKQLQTGTTSEEEKAVVASAKRELLLRKQLRLKKEAYQYDLLESTVGKLSDVQRRKLATEKQIAEFRQNVTVNAPLNAGDNESWEVKRLNAEMELLDLKRNEHRLRKQELNDAEQLAGLRLKAALTASKDREGQRKLLLEDRKNLRNKMEQAARTGDTQKFIKYANEYQSLTDQYAELSKSTRKYFNGIVTTSQGLRFGSLEAYREQRKIYETRPSDDRNDKVIRRNAANKVIALLPVLKKTLDTIANNTEKGVGNGSVTFQAR